MRRRGRLVWKLSAVVIWTVILVIGATGLVGSILNRHFALETAREVMHYNSASLVSSIDRLMMTRNNEGVRTLLDEFSRGSEVYREISLVSHPDGEVVASHLNPVGSTLGPESEDCLLCHIDGAQPIAPVDTLDVIHEDHPGGRVMHIVTPIYNRETCRTADCHAHTDDGPMLGFLKTDYAMAGVDRLITRQNVLMLVAAFLAVILATGALYFMFLKLLDLPVRNLFKGLGALAANDLSFRFPAVRDDEIGLVEKTFNRMAAEIESQQFELLEAMEFLEGIVENSADLIITVDPGGIIQTFNRGAEEALGYDREEVVGRHIETLFADPRERDVAIQRLRERDNVTNYRTRFLAKNGEVRHVLLTLSRLRDWQGNSIGTFGISKDLTVERDLEQKLKKSEQIAAIGRAVTGIQHAIKNMLNTLRGGLYVARLGHEKGKESMFEEGCRMLEEGLAYIGGLSLNMLTYAREWKVDAERVDLVALAKRVEVAVKQQAEEHGGVFRVEGDESLPKVSCDPRLIHMVLMDLATNALDACGMKDYGEGESPEIVLSVSRAKDGEHVLIEVRDNGPGMTEAMVESAFTPFVTTKKWGTGLGLALAARIAELHKGAIEVESEPDEGATFRITLPLPASATNQGEDNG